MSQMLNDELGDCVWKDDWSYNPASYQAAMTVLKLAAYPSTTDTIKQLRQVYKSRRIFNGWRAPIIRSMRRK